MVAIDYFIDKVPETEIRLRLREVGPKSINEAENIAVRLEELPVADKQKVRMLRAIDAADHQSSGMKDELTQE